MKATKREKLEAAGWKVGSTSEFLGLSETESMLIDIKLSLAWTVKEMRLKQEMTQGDLASLIGSSQSRIAKVEAADSSVSIELLVKCLAAMGASRPEIGNILGNEQNAQKQEIKSMKP